MIQMQAMTLIPLMQSIDDFDSLTFIKSLKLEFKEKIVTKFPGSLPNFRSKISNNVLLDTTNTSATRM